MITINLSSRRTLVTGANFGLGRAIALNYTAADAHVAAHALNDHISAEAIFRQVQQEGGEAVAVYADVSQPPQVEKMFTEVDAVLGGLDILVNNAGMDGAREMRADSNP